MKIVKTKKGKFKGEISMKNNFLKSVAVGLSLALSVSGIPIGSVAEAATSHPDYKMYHSTAAG